MAPWAKQGPVLFATLTFVALLLGRFEIAIARAPGSSLLASTGDSETHAEPGAREPSLAVAVFWPESGRWTVQVGLETTASSSGGTRAAHGYYDEARLPTSGWAQMDISVSEMHPSSQESHLIGMYGLGFLEGHLTCRRIEQFVGNFMPEMFKPKGAPPPDLVTWVEKQFQWVQARANSNSGGGSMDHGYWAAVNGVLAQFDGVLAGYADGCPDAKPLAPLDLLLLNLNGDLFDIIPALRRSAGNTGKDYVNVRTGMPPFPVGIDRPAHCSAAVKMVPNDADGSFSDLLVGHATWDTFSNAYPRIFKHVTLPVWSQDAGAWQSHTATFSSSPGFLSSIDDFYSISGSASLFVQETSISVLDEDLYKLLKPESVPCFIRSVTANRLAKGGESWAEVFSKEHSGTYNDQWMVVDRSRFTPGMTAGSAQPGLLWVLEEAPGAITSRDMTSHLLSHGYWSSFNIAFFPKMRDYMGYTEAEKEAQMGAEYSYTECARARLFKRLLKQVKDETSMQWVMRWNDFQVDPVSNGNPVWAIAARGDLKQPRTPNGRRQAFGAIDSKVASWKSTELGEVAALAMAGPTREQQAEFCWTGEFKESHKGHPECFNMTQMAIARSRWHSDKGGDGSLLAAEETQPRMTSIAAQVLDMTATV